MNGPDIKKITVSFRNILPERDSLCLSEAILDQVAKISRGPIIDNTIFITGKRSYYSRWRAFENYFSPFHPVKLQFGNLANETEALITKKIGESDKIEELVKDAVLNRWVSEGRLQHKGKRENCGFCGGAITPERWGKLEKHFDETVCSRIEKAVLCYTDFDDQCDSALDEIETVLIELGVLKGPKCYVAP